MKNQIEIFNDGLLMYVHVSYWSGAKLLQPQDLGLEREDVAEAFKLGRKMLVPEEVIREFRRLDANARRIVEENSFSFPIGHARFVPKTRLAEVEKKLEEYKARWYALVDSLIANYNAYREQMRPVYLEAARKAHEQSGSEQSLELFTELFMDRINAYYPPAETLRDRYSLYWDIYEVTIPKSTLSEEYQAKVKEKMDGFLGEVVGILREQTVEACERIRKNLKEGKICRGQTVSSLRAFIDKFHELNFVGDAIIEKKLDELRSEILNRYPTKAINDSPALQEQLGRKLRDIVLSAKEMVDINTVTGQYKRKLQWDDSEEEKVA
jgi:hypothetical protein